MGTVSRAGDIVWGSLPHRTEFSGEKMTGEYLDEILLHLRVLGIFS